MSQGKRGAQWSPWTPVADLERAAPLFARLSGQTGEEMVRSLRHLKDLGLLEVRRTRGARGRQQFRVRTDDAARARALLDDHAQARRN